MSMHSLLRLPVLNALAGVLLLLVLLAVFGPTVVTPSVQLIEVRNNDSKTVFFNCETVTSGVVLYRGELDPNQKVRFPIAVAAGSEVALGDLRTLILQVRVLDDIPDSRYESVELHGTAAGHGWVVTIGDGEIHTEEQEGKWAPISDG